MRRPKIKHETIEKWIKYLQAQDAPVKSQDLARILVLVQEQLYYNSVTHVEEDGNVYYNSGVGHSHGVMWDELKFAIKVSTIVDAIETYYGTGFNLPAFSDDFFGNSSNTNASR